MKKVENKLAKNENNRKQVRVFLMANNVEKSNSPKFLILIEFLFCF
jgi:hypothetical protein